MAVTVNPGGDSASGPARAGKPDAITQSKTITTELAADREMLWQQ